MKQTDARLRCYVMASILVLTGCGSANERAFERNPDRDLTGMTLPLPMLADSITTLRRIAVDRAEWNVDLPAARAEELLSAGIHSCHQGRSHVSLKLLTWMAGGIVGLGIAGRSGFNITRTVSTESWPEYNATAIGIGVDLGAFAGRGYMVVYAVEQVSANSSRVYAYRREDSGFQRNMVALAPIWLAGRTEVCDARS